jgi:Protein of unknown function (DUF4235)
MSKLLSKSFSLLISLVGGIVAGAIFKQIWRIAAREEEAPSATDARRGWPEVLAAAALEGAIFALVKAALQRGTATATRQITGTWPGEENGVSEPESKDND